MAKEKIKAMVRGKILELSPKSFEIAKEYFGAVKVDDLITSKPIELSKPILIPKIPVKVEKPVELIKKEPDWDKKLADKLASPIPQGPMIEVKQVVEVPKVVKKPAARKKK